MSALKKGALLKAFVGKPADAEKVPLPYDDRVILNNIEREVQTTLATRNIFQFQARLLGRHAMSRSSSQVA